MATYSFGNFLSPPGVNGGTTGYNRYASMTGVDNTRMSDTWNLTTSGVDTFSIRIVGELAGGPPGSVKLLSLSYPYLNANGGAPPYVPAISGATLISANTLAIGNTYNNGYLSGNDISIGGFWGNYSGGTEINATFRVTAPNIQFSVFGYSWNGPGTSFGDPIGYTIQVNYLTSTSSSPLPPSQDDFADSLADTSSPKGNLVVNGTATGTLETIGDHDWFSVQLTSGHSYVINMRGSPSGGGTLSDPYLYLHNSAGTLLDSNDDGVGVGADSQLTTRATTSGTYYIDAGAYSNGFAGTYTVEIRDLTGPGGRVQRFFDSATGDHFYTLSVAEADQIRATLPTFHDEGSPWSAPNAGPNTTDVFRFFDTATNTHFLTSSTVERDFIIAHTPTLQFEGVAFQAYTAPEAGTLTLERFFNTVTGLHHLSASAAETASLHTSTAIGAGWVDEGAGFIVHV